MPISSSQYTWLDTVGTLPRMIVEARALQGTHELAGPADNPTILAWAREVGGDVAAHYGHDSVPWCGLFMAVVAKRAGKTPPVAPLWALNWGKFGVEGGQPELGDVLTFIRQLPDGTSAGHVALYIGEDAECFHILGGNQTDQVCFDRIDKGRLRAVRQPPYMSRPNSVRPYIVPATGGKSAGQA